MDMDETVIYELIKTINELKVQIKELKEEMKSLGEDVRGNTFALGQSRDGDS